MIDVAKDIKVSASALQKRIIEEYAQVYGINEPMDVDNLLNLLRAKKNELTPLTKLKDLGIRDKARIRSGHLNSIYKSIESDIYLLFSTAGGIEQLIDGYRALSEERYNRIEGQLKEQEARLAVVKNLRDNPTHREAWAIDLQANISESDYHPVFNTSEQALSLNAIKSSLVTVECTKSVEFCGNPTLFSLPGYELDNIVDHSKLTAWFNIAAYKIRPINMFDFSLTQPCINAIDSVRAMLSPGDTAIALNRQSVSVGDPITIGNSYESNMETTTVTGITSTGITVTALTKSHYTGEPIFVASNVTQLSGAVAYINFTYKFPQSVNLVRVYPFASRPIKVIGLYQKVNNEWIMIRNTNVGYVDKQAVLTFDTVFNSMFRLVIQQQHGMFQSIMLDKDKQNSNDVWETLYAQEYGVATDNINSRLSSFTQEEIDKAKSEGRLLSLLKKTNLHDIQKKIFKPAASSSEEVSQDLSVLDKYISSDPSQNVRVNRYIYEVGLLEVEFYDNQFLPVGEYLSKELTPKMEFTSCLLEAVEDTATGSSITHSIITAEGDVIPMPNMAIVDSANSPRAVNEFIDVDHTTRLGTLRFVPLQPTVTITRVYPDNVVTTFNNVLVINSQQIDLMQNNMYHQKGVFQATYSIKEPTVDVISNLVSKPFVFETGATSSGQFVVLPKSPCIEYGIVNDSIRWKKRSAFECIWDLVVTQDAWVDPGTKSFHIDGLVFDNIYYGPACVGVINRSTHGLETFLFAMFSRYSSNPAILVNRFFNTYSGTVLNNNISYKPFSVYVNSIEASNLSNYDGSPDSGFLSSIPSTEQYRHFETSIMFPQALKDVNIRVEYRIRETMLQYSGTLYCNKNSEFVHTPLLRSVVLATE